MYIDGAILDNYPIQLFQQYKETTLGFLIESDRCKEIKDISNYIQCILSCINSRLKHYQKIGFEDKTIELNIKIDGLQFDIDEKKNKLFWNVIIKQKSILSQN